MRRLTTMFLLPATVGVATLLLTGCPSDQATSSAPPAVARTASPSEPLTDAGGSDVGNGKNPDGDYVCPVMGSALTELSDELAVEHEGKTYYFCCAGCPEAFEKDPAKYIAAIEAGEAPEGTEATDAGGTEGEHDHAGHSHG